jgi:ADP-ribose pyrophosphatase YjhB (NUDIX family)
MFKYCPACASQKIIFEGGRFFRCPDCGFVYYHNIAAATGCLISVPCPDGERFVFTVRGKEPGKGFLDLPGGFIDIGEGAIEGLYREMREEIGWAPQDAELYASFANVYKYKGIDYNTCDLYFTVSAPGLKPEDLCLQEGEITGVKFLKREEINLDEFAFESTKKAVKAYFDKKN